MKIIKCPIWGDVQITDRALQIIDTPAFQRLHSIKQLGFIYRVFPGAVHTRFSHSIGCYAIAQNILHHIQIQQPHVYQNTPRWIWECIPLGALCHDIGHGPFSHWFDELWKDYDEKEIPWKSHERRGWDIIVSLSVFNENELCLLHSMLFGPQRHWYEKLIYNSTSLLDIDKMDYLLRDVYYLGIRRNIDVKRIWVYSKVMIDSKNESSDIVFSERVKEEIEELARLRSYMYTHIYHHPASKRMENELVDYYQEQKTEWKQVLVHKKLDDFLEWTDDVFLHFMFDKHSLSKLSKYNWTCRIWKHPKLTQAGHVPCLTNPTILPTFVSLKDWKQLR